MKAMAIYPIASSGGLSETCAYFIVGFAFFLCSGLLRRFTQRPITIPSGIVVQTRHQKVVEIRRPMAKTLCRRSRCTDVAS